MGETASGGRRGIRAAGLAVVAALAVLLIGTPAGTALADDAGGHTPSADDRYALANGCFALRSVQNGDYVVKAAGAYAATAASAATAEPFRMQATDLGTYLLYDSDEQFMANGLLNAVQAAANPSDNSDWTVEDDSGDFRLRVAGRDMAVGALGAIVTVTGGTSGAAGVFDFSLLPDSDCPAYPEIEVNVDGPLPPTGSPTQPVRGLIETHMHQMAFEFLSTKAHCGRPWHRFGAPSALVDCPDHALTGGCGAILETALTGTTCHDPGGWPTFTGWPDHRQFTHEQSYYKWLERSWRGGLRIFVNLLVENRILCQLYDVQVAAGPPSPHGCDEMETVRREAQRMRELERYIDAQNGGPDKGWYEIVESPAEARQAIADGKLAVVMGMEVSEPFGCILNALTDTSQCTPAELDDGIDEVYDLGVRQLEIVNKFDNGLTGVAGDSGTTGTITNGGNFLSTQSFWDYQTCPPGPDDPALNHDHSPTALSHNDDQLIANGLLALLPISLPAYGPAPHCNQLGLSDLGEQAINRIIDKGMLFDPDHMSVIARNQALDLIESENYPGVMTSHSWSTDNALPRISALGGLIGPAAKSPEGFVAEWNHIKTHGYDALNPDLFGFGYGADMNGFASQGGPPSSPITYPFQSPIDPSVTVHKQQSGSRTFDINADGTAHYGLYADWYQAVCVAGGQDIIDEMANGAEAYLRMWERATGASPGSGPGAGAGQDSCASDAAAGNGAGDKGAAACAKWPRKFTSRGLGKRLRIGADEAAVLRKAGEPQSREGRAWTWCARARRGGRTNRVVAVFGGDGAVKLIATNGKSRSGAIRRGTKVAALRGRAERLGKAFWVRPAGKDNVFFYRARKGKIAYVGLATKAAAKPASLRASLAPAGLR